MHRLLTSVAAAVITAGPVLADFKIRAARIAEGDLWVVGEVDEPNATVTLDDSYSEKTDGRGRFQFRIAYHPAMCAVVLKTERQSRAVVIANCGQRGPAGPEGPPGPPGPKNPVVGFEPQGEPTLPEVSCGLKAALYAAANGFQVWVTRKGVVRQTGSPKLRSAQPELVLQVSISGGVASLRGATYGTMLRGGPPQEIEAATGQLINWERLVDTLPASIQIVSDTGPEPIARLTFKGCGTAPRPLPSRPPGSDAASPASEAPGGSAPAPRPLPQGALP